jgi:hypothetical protein
MLKTIGRKLKSFTHKAEDELVHLSEKYEDEILEAREGSGGDLKHLNDRVDGEYKLTHSQNRDS